VIEDSADAAESLKEALELSDHEVDVAYTGAEGIEKARTFKPDVVLCDIGLPGLSGFEVARAFRADPDLSAIPLIALSGYALPEDVDRARGAGFDLHLAKPPDLPALERSIAEARGKADAG
jgi:CheY-like chemotaxis protein